MNAIPITSGVPSWAGTQRSTGKFLPYETPLKNLYLVGQWVFPGGGVPAVRASGYFVARQILRRAGIDLEERLEQHFKQSPQG